MYIETKKKLVCQIRTLTRKWVQVDQTTEWQYTDWPQNDTITIYPIIEPSTSKMWTMIISGNINRWYILFMWIDFMGSGVGDSVLFFRLTEIQELHQKSASWFKSKLFSKTTLHLSTTIKLSTRPNNDFRIETINYRIFIYTENAESIVCWIVINDFPID